MRVQPLAVALSVLVFMTLSCQPPVDDTIASLQEDLAAIRAQDAAFQDAVRAMDFAAAAEILAEDVVVLPPNHGSIVGRTAWTEWVATWGIAEVSQYDIGIEDLHVSGDFAYLRGTFFEVLSLEGMTEPYVDEGKGLKIWKKNADGSWQIAVEIFNSDLPLPAPEGIE